MVIGQEWAKLSQSVQWSCMLCEQFWNILMRLKCLVILSENVVSCKMYQNPEPMVVYKYIKSVHIWWINVYLLIGTGCRVNGMLAVENMIIPFWKYLINKTTNFDRAVYSNGELVKTADQINGSCDTKLVGRNHFYKVTKIRVHW